MPTPTLIQEHTICRIGRILQQQSLMFSHSVCRPFNKALRARPFPTPLFHVGQRRTMSTFLYDDALRLVLAFLASDPWALRTAQCVCRCWSKLTMGAPVAVEGIPVSFSKSSQHFMQVENGEMPQMPQIVLRRLGRLCCFGWPDRCLSRDCPNQGLVCVGVSNNAPVPLCACGRQSNTLWTPVRPHIWSDLCTPDGTRYPQAPLGRWNCARPCESGERLS